MSTPDELAGVTEAVAQQVVTTLAKHGLDVEWDGSLQRRILVRVPHWRRRLPARRP